MTPPTDAVKLNFQHYFIQAYQHPNKWSAKITNKYKLKIFLQILGKQPLIHIHLRSAIYWMCVFGLLTFNRWNGQQFPFKCTSCLTKWENTVPVIKCPQWPNGTTVSCNAMSLKFFAFIITHLFHNICLKGLYVHKRLYKV